VIVMAEIAQLCDFAHACVEARLRANVRPAPAAMAQAIATQLARNEIWDRARAGSLLRSWRAALPRSTVDCQ
jgi:hypothetical protein